MHSVSLFLIISAIIMIIIAVILDYSHSNNNQDSIRSQLVSKGLPTPAFATLEELKKILKIKTLKN